LLVLPTGAGKSLIAADAARRAHAAEKRTLIVAPTRELVRQDADAVEFVTGKAIVPTLACAGLGEVNVTGEVVIGTPQTLVRRLDDIGRIDVLIVDEAHRLGRKASGQIHTIVSTLRERNPDLMLLGMTASPYRLDSGRLTEGADRVFDAVAFEVGYLELVDQGYLAPLVGPRSAIERLEVRGLRVVGGDYAASDLTRFDRAELTERIADQILEHGAERKAWLVFGVSVKHASHLAQALVARGIDARLLTGQTPKDERRKLVADFKAGRVRCLVGVDVFSVGFDAPAVDLIAIVRPTCSPVWHVQSAGRGTRVAPRKRNCLILDFASNFARLGPIDAPHVRAKGQRARDNDDAPLTRCCPRCDAIIAARAQSCPVCAVVLVDRRERNTDKLSTRAAGHAAVTGSGMLPVLGVRYAVHCKIGRPDSLRLEYRVSGFRYPSVSEWLCCWHDGLAGIQARSEWRRRLRPGAPSEIPCNAATAVIVASSRLRWPASVRVTPDGEFTRVVPLFQGDAMEVA
jgi:DNA repair protein RadD